MLKKIKKDNTLIKRKNLVLFLKEKGFKRVGKDSLGLIEKFLVEDLDKFSEVLKEKMLVKGKRVLDREIVEDCLEEKN